MLKILQYEISFCEICKAKYSNKNKPHILICGNTLCENCLKSNINNNEIVCPFDKEHTHKNDENFPINYSFLNTLTDLNSIIDFVYKKKGDISKIKKSLLVENLSNIKNDNQFKCDDFYFVGNLNKNNKPNGKGKLTHHKLNLIIEGTFNNDFNKGRGQIIYNNGDIYFGEFDEFKKIGEGDLIYNNGDKYKGSFKNDKLEGEGILIKKEEKKIIKGHFENNLLNGEGYLFTKGSKFPKKVLYSNGKEEKILLEEDKTVEDVILKKILKNL